VPEHQQVRLKGRIKDVRDRWTPDGSFAVIASLVITRPALGPVRANVIDEQPIPLRANNEAARTIVAQHGNMVQIEGVLRRRYYSQHGEKRWGQVEVWVDLCRPLNQHSQENLNE